MSEQRWQVVVSWGWGRRYGFAEESSFVIHDREDLARDIEHTVQRIADSYAFDCGRLDYPLNPRIYGVMLTPIGETESVPSDPFNRMLQDAVKTKREKLKERLKEPTDA